MSSNDPLQANTAFMSPSDFRVNTVSHQMSLSPLPKKQKGDRITNQLTT